MEWSNSGRMPGIDGTYRRTLLPATAISLVVHGLVFAALLPFWNLEQGRVPGSSETVIIALLPRVQEFPPPQQIVPPSVASEEITGSEPVHPLATPPADSPPETLPDREPTRIPVLSASDFPEREALISLPEVPHSPRSSDTAASSISGIGLIDSLTLQQSVRQEYDQRVGESWRSGCSSVQRRSELLECDETENADIDWPGPGLTVRGPGWEISGQTTRPVADTVFLHQVQLTQRIQALSFSPAITGYLLDEISQGVEVYRSTGNTRLQRLTDQIYRDDPAYRQMQRIMEPR